MTKLIRGLSAALGISILAAAGCGYSTPAAVSRINDYPGNVSGGSNTVSYFSAVRKAEFMSADSAGISWDDLDMTGSMSLQHASQFQVDTYEAGSEKVVYSLITIPEDGQEFLLVPEDAPVPAGLPEDVTVLCQPLDHTYLVSTSVMDYICTLDALDQIRFSGTKEEDWTISEAQEAMDLGYIDYAGKYSQPDYELLLGGGCNFAIENTMIYHNPEVKEKLEDIEIPVLVERSSYEEDPLGRLEWIRLYGLLYDRQEEADSWYGNAVEEIEPILHEDNTGETAAFFAVNSNGSVTIRKPGDYISKLIEMAGGTYVPSSTQEQEDNALSTMTVQMEEFYASAVDADFLIYNSTIEGEITSTQDLIAKNQLFADFKAVQDGNAYCTGQNLYQQPTGMGEFVKELHMAFTHEDDEDMQFLTRVGG